MTHTVDCKYKALEIIIIILFIQVSAAHFINLLTYLLTYNNISRSNKKFFHEYLQNSRQISGFSRHPARTVFNSSSSHRCRLHGGDGQKVVGMMPLSRPHRNFVMPPLYTAERYSKNYECVIMKVKKLR